MGLIFAASCVFACAVSRAGSLDLALEHYMRGEYEAAIGDADRALSTGQPSDHDRARANLIKAQSFDKLGDVDSAVGLYRYVVESHPDSAQAYQARQRLRSLERSGVTRP